MKARWKVHTPNLLKEMMSSCQADVLAQPVRIFGLLLFAVVERAAEINDPVLNDLMCRLTFYSIADPMSEDYDRELVGNIRELAEKVKGER
jgi:hypothetical protein